MGLVDSRVRVQSRVGHNPVDEIVYDGSDIVHTAQAVVERWSLRRWRVNLWHFSPQERLHWKPEEYDPALLTSQYRAVT
jgi:hypothetical protein